MTIGTGAASIGKFTALYGGGWNSNYTSMYHDGTDGKMVTGAGNLVLTPASGRVTIGQMLHLSAQSAAPGSPSTGDIALANRTNWDPLSKGSGGPYPVWYNGSAWVSLAGQ